ncbi:MAG: transporter, partial [Akkermansia sp.]|nr:transporter [Akkermansia sp.]
IIPGILAYNLFRDDLANKADSNTAAIVQKAEASGKKVIYDVAASRFVRGDAASSSVDYVKKNLTVVGAADKVAEVDAKAAELAAIPAADIAAREAKAKEILAIDKAATKDARANSAEYTVTTTLAAYQYDYAFATLLRKLLPGTGWAWFVLAALFGAVVSSLASMLNSASTLFTMDIYAKAKEVAGSPASNRQLVAMGKIGVLVCAVIATVISPFLDNPAFGGIFTFIQEFQGFLSPGVLAVFLFGFFVPKCPRIFGWLGILVGAVSFAAFKWVDILGCTDSSFLNRMGYSLIVVCLVGAFLTVRNALTGGEAVVLGDKGIIQMKTSGRAKAFGLAVIVATIALYIIFW